MFLSQIARPAISEKQNDVMHLPPNLSASLQIFLKPITRQIENTRENVSQRKYVRQKGYNPYKEKILGVLE